MGTAGEAQLLPPAVAPTFLWEATKIDGPRTTAAPTQGGSFHMLWATAGAWERGLRAIGTWACVLAPICASVASAVLTSWDGSALS